MTFLPICINITDKKILIVGGGNTAAHKLKTLLKFTNNIAALAPEMSDEIKKSGIKIIEKNYSKKFLNDFYLIYACTNNKNLNLKIKSDANKLGKLVNVCDSPDNCDFVSPAIFKRQNMSVAVSSNAQDVRKSIEWRNKIAEFFNGNFSIF